MAKKYEFDETMVKIGPKNKKVDFSEGVLAAEGGEQAILKMVVTIGTYTGPYIGYIWPYI